MDWILTKISIYRANVEGKENYKSKVTDILIISQDVIRDRGMWFSWSHDVLNGGCDWEGGPFGSEPVVLGPKFVNIFN